MRALAVAIVLCAARVASAQIADDFADLSGTFPDDHLRLELGVGLPDFNTFAYGHRVEPGLGVHLEGGVRYDRIALALDGGVRTTTYDRLTTGPTVWWETVAGRYSALAGKSEVRTKHTHRLIGYTRSDTWLEAGAGREQFTWNGDAVTRPTLLVGIGTELTNHYDDSHFSAMVSLRVMRTTDPSGAVGHEVIGGLTLLFGD